MRKKILSFFNNLQLRWKMLVMVLPLVVIPIIIVGNVIGYIATQQAYRGLTQTSKDDLDHMADFTIDLLEAHFQQFQVYQRDKEQTTREELRAVTDLAYSLVETQNHQYLAGKLDLATAKREANQTLKKVNVGASGYIYAMTSEGTLVAHLAREGENIYDEQDENGHHFIRTMSRKAQAAGQGEVLFIVYPWRNPGEVEARNKIVAYRYFPEWDWIIATGGYLEETYEDVAFEKRSFEKLKKKIKNKKVGLTGYIYCMDSSGTLTLHPDSEGENIIGATDLDGSRFIAEMCRRKEGWIHYPWRNPGEEEARRKIVRYRYFEPWDWIVAVSSYEDEFYGEANLIRGRIIDSLVLISLLVGLTATGLVFLAAKVFTDPLHRMIAAIRRVKRGRLDQEVTVDSNDELGELAASFNRMTGIIRRNREMEAALAQQGKMASLGVLSSGVAHEINNPLGVILGYAGYLESKIEPENPHYRYVSEIKRESKRCKKIVQDLLSYARTPRPSLEETDINVLLNQIVDFAANHTDLHHVKIRRDFSSGLPPLMVDGDQMRQVAINLILNAGAAMPDGGELVVASRLGPSGEVHLLFSDSGTGIPEEDQEKIFEPFFTTKERGTGLGLAITRQIVEQHHGRIGLESVPGRGTTVVIRLPIEREEY